MYKLLLVDDEEEIVNYLKQYFTKKCKDFFEIEISLTYRGALEILKSKHIDIMLCDVNLTDGNGLDLMKIVLEKYKSTKILMLSGQSRFEDVYETQKAKIKFISKLETEEYILQMIQEELMGMNTTTSRIEHTNLSENTDVVAFVVDYINKNYNQYFTLEDLSSLVYMNSSYLSRLFKKVTGKSLFEYVNDVRIEQSIAFLKDPNYKLKDIYKMVGYSTANYYNRVFKLKIGISPKQYRRNTIEKL